MNLELKLIKQIYFIGIGGIGMSALAFHFLRMGKSVLGYDKNSTDISKSLENNGAKIEYDIDLKLAKTISNENTLVIYTPAIKDNHPIFKYFKSKNYKLFKRAEILGKLSQDKTCIAVAGTHGKTTITSMLAFLLKDNNEPVTAFLGGVSENYQTNYIYNGDDVFVIEADEFDRSLLQLQPDFAVISNIDADHLDVYKNKEDLVDTFKIFAQQVKQLFHHKHLDFHGQSISLEGPANYYAQNISIKDAAYHFDWVSPHQTLEDIVLQMPGHYNLFNAICALTLASAYQPEKIKNFAKSLSKFEGVRRRFNYIVKNPDQIIIDDYAHHPTEIKAVYEAIREMHPGKKIMAIFQPHLFSRTQDFADDFAKELRAFDEVNLLKIYPAREEPIKGIDAKFLCDKIKNRQKAVIHKNEILPIIKASNCEVIVLMGAGDIGLEAQRLKQYYSHEK